MIAGSGAGGNSPQTVEQAVWAPVDDWRPDRSCAATVALSIADRKGCRRSIGLEWPRLQQYLTRSHYAAVQGYSLGVRSKGLVWAVAHANGLADSGLKSSACLAAQQQQRLIFRPEYPQFNPSLSENRTTVLGTKPRRPVHFDSEI